MKYFSSYKQTLLAFLCISFSIVSYANEQMNFTKEEAQWLRNHKKIRVMVGTWPPFHYVENGKNKGLALEYVKIILKDLGLEMVPVPILWSDALKSISNFEKVDLLPTIARNKEREKLVNISKNYLSFPMVIFTRKDFKTISNLKDLYGKIISVEKNFIMHKRLLKDHPQIKILPTKTSSLALEKVSLGESDAYVSNLAVGSFLIDKLGLFNLKVAANTNYKNDTQGIGVRRDWQILTQLINKRLKLFTAEEHTKLRKKSLSVRFEHGISFKFILGIVSGAIFILILVGVWNRKLSAIIKEKELAQNQLREKQSLLEISNSDLKKASEELINAKEKAEKSNQFKSIFLANMSHELRTPLNSILGFSEILSGMDLKNEQKNYLEAISISGKSLLSLINDILDISKIEAGHIELHSQPAQLGSMLDEIEIIFHEMAFKKDLDFSINTSSVDRIYFLLDEDRLRQCLVNLISNALKFTQEGSVKVNIDIEPLNETNKNYHNISISIKDTGVGIAEDEIKTIFQEFQQKKDQKVSDYGGTGLGLSICKKVIELMGGTITVKSDLGVGSEFIINLPKIEIATNYSIIIQEKELDASKIKLGPGKLLIVDDINNNIMVLKGYLMGQNLEILEASDGKEAIEVTKKEKPDFILMDIKMPIMDGKEASIQLHKDPETKEIPICALSASALKHEENEIKEIVGEFIKKPISKQELFSILIKYFPFEVTSDDKKTNSKVPVDMDMDMDMETLIQRNPHILKSLNNIIATGDHTALTNLIKQLDCPSKEVYDFLEGRANNFDFEYFRNLVGKKNAA